MNIKALIEKIKKPKLKLHMVRKSQTFDVNAKHDKLKLLMVFVKRGHGNPTNDLLLNCGISTTTMLYTFGTKTTYAQDIFGGEEKNKETIIALVPEQKYKDVQKALLKRFSLYPSAQGITLAFDIKSLAGILAYKYLTDYEGANKYEESIKS